MKHCVCQFIGFISNLLSGSTLDHSVCVLIYLWFKVIPIQFTIDWRVFEGLNNSLNKENHSHHTTFLHDTHFARWCYGFLLFESRISWMTRRRVWVFNVSSHRQALSVEWYFDTPVCCWWVQLALYTFRLYEAVGEHYSARVVQKVYRIYQIKKQSTSSAEGFCKKLGLETL